MTLLILVIQGYIFAGLLLRRFYDSKNQSDLLLAIFLIITGYHRTSYILGFMGWYDTFRNTKINYYLINLSLALGPLIYFYVKSIVVSRFRFRKIDSWHFVPVGIYMAVQLIILGYDQRQEGFDLVQNGELKTSFEMTYINVAHEYLSGISLLIYLVVAILMYRDYRRLLVQQFSNTYVLELRWLRNFLAVYVFVFIFGIVQDYINISIMNLHWTQSWWVHFVSACAMVYLGVYGYFTDLGGLKNLEPSSSTLTYNFTSGYQKDNKSAKETERLSQLRQFMEDQKPYLDPELNLTSLARMVDLGAAELSNILNQQAGINFNDFVNSFRIEAVKNQLKAGKAEQLSLLGIAFNAGFNSKATFNRTFKKWTGVSPSIYLKQMDQ